MPSLVWLVEKFSGNLSLVLASRYCRAIAKVISSHPRRGNAALGRNYRSGEALLELLLTTGTPKIKPRFSDYLLMGLCDLLINAILAKKIPYHCLTLNLLLNVYGSLLMRPYCFGSRYHLGGGHSRHLSDEPQEVHSRHEDGVRRSQEEEGPGRPDRVPPRRHKVEGENFRVRD